MFAVIYRAAQVTVRAELDNTVAGEAADIISDVQDDHKSIIASVQEAIEESPGTFYALIIPGGAVLAGNFTVPPPVRAIWRGKRTFERGDGLDLPRRVTAIRGLATRLPDGSVLYVAENASSLHALNQLITQAFLAVFGSILVLGLAGGLLVARATFRRVEGISNTAREIIHGDLSRRIAIAGSGDEFDRLAENLNAMLERIQALMENVQQVSSDIAHDLRSPLARLREHLELAGRNAQEPETRLAFEAGIEQVDAALGIFAAMLRIAEVEAGARRRDFRSVDLSGLLIDLAETFETVAEAEGKAVAADIPDGLNVTGDPELLTQMFVNIIENAIRYSPAGSRVGIAAQPGAPGRLDVVICDNGPGIPANEHRRVLKRFVRLDASRHSAGAGLGLALAAAVAELHDGSIGLSCNEPGLRVTIGLRSAV